MVDAKCLRRKHALIPPGIFVLHDGMGLVAKRLEHVPVGNPPCLHIIADKTALHAL